MVCFGSPKLTLQSTVYVYISWCTLKVITFHTIKRICILLFKDGEIK